MCKWCEKEEITKYEVIGRSRKGKQKWGDKKYFVSNAFMSCPNMRIEDSKLIVDYDAYSCDSSFYEEVKINYCPFCGRKLNTDAILLQEEKR